MYWEMVKYKLPSKLIIHVKDSIEASNKRCSGIALELKKSQKKSKIDQENMIQRH